MRLSLCLCGLLLASVPAAASAPSQQDATVHIGLCKHFANAHMVLISDDGPFTLEDAQSGAILFHGQPGMVFQVCATPQGLRVTRDSLKDAAAGASESVPVKASSEGSQPLKIARLDRSSSASLTSLTSPAGVHWAEYRGTFTIERDSAGALRVINNVALEQYLYGVLPAEIGSDAPAEALKAQAVAARTYALKNRGKFAADGFDLDDTTRSEGYDGVNGETAAVDAAVDATRGLVLTWNGSLIDAPYSTDSGGMTACDPESPYLQAVRDAATPDGPDYAADQKYHNWSLVYTPAQLQAALAADPRSRVSSLQSFTLDGFDASGRITTATITGMDGTTKTVTGPQLRQILGYDVLRSTLVTMTIQPDGDYQFAGKGWGHGLGMSQEGAVAMAEAPYHDTYQDILSHYYVGTALMPWRDAQRDAPASATVPIAQSASRPRRGA